uniref:TXNDC11 thioredoxin-like domain-containing protein n=1 Tax=Anguilla anguilla TaxID=7936 RepID=A0A0E9SGD8_ANGAN
MAPSNCDIVLCTDYRGGVRFGVVTNKHVAEAIPLQEDEMVYLHRHFNKSLVNVLLASCCWFSTGSRTSSTYS